MMKELPSTIILSVKQSDERLTSIAIILSALFFKCNYEIVCRPYYLNKHLQIYTF